MKQFLIPAVLAVLAMPVSAQDQQVGARTKAMGGSYTAFEDDPVSVWLNPAGIASQPDGLAISYQTFNIYELSGDDKDNVVPRYMPEVSWTDPALLPSYLGATFQLGDAESPHSLGFCFTTPFRLKFGYFEDGEQVQTDPDRSIPLEWVDQTFYRIRGAYAHDVRLKPAGSEGFFTHLAFGAGLDISVTNWTFTKIQNIEVTQAGGGPGSVNSSITASATDIGFGGGAGLLLGLYDNTRNFKVNLGAAFQSKVGYDYSLDVTVVPLFDWPTQIQAGLTFYLLEGLPLRITLDAQLIRWDSAATDSDIAGLDNFKDATNLSLGLEYRLKASKKITIYPRLGLRYYDAPWDTDEKPEMPAVGKAQLAIHTKDEEFIIYSGGFGIGWASEAGKLRSFDLGFDVGGDSPSLAFGFNMEF